MSSTNDNIPSNQLIKKEARGIGDSSLGEIKEVSDEYVITEKGILDKDRFYIPEFYTTCR